MNFVGQNLFLGGILEGRVSGSIRIFLAILLCLYLVGCGDQVQLPTAAQLSEFEGAGPTRPAVDWERLVGAKMVRGPYRVVVGDVLELMMPAMLQAVTAQMPETTERFAPYLCRVDEDGTISLPIVGKVQAAGKTLAEIELAVIDAYHPKYAVLRPAVTARVTEYRTAKVAISGAIAKPGVYELRADQMSLVALLMQAGGIVDEGAAGIRIIHPTETVPEKQQDQKSAEPAGQVTGQQSGQLIDQAVKTTVEEILQQAIEKSTEHDVATATELQQLYPQVSEIEQIKVQITFAQFKKPDTAGLLTVKHDDKVLLIEQMDVTSRLQRQAVIEKLAQIEPRVSTIRVGQSLRQLAEQLGGSVNPPEPVEEPSIDARRISLAGLKGPRLAGTQTQCISDASLEKLKGVLETVAHAKTVETQKIAEFGEVEKAKPIVLPVRGLNIPFADVELCEGYTVVVEPLQMPIFSVIGLVSKPGNFPYPPDVKYNLMQAIAFAGGLEQAADPRYVTIYRLKADGTIINAPFKIIGGSNSAQLTEALNIPVKPGDIVAVEHTPRTRATLFLQRIFSVHVGAYIPVWR